MSGARHLYVHLPFCSSRCGYCDFVTVIGQAGSHAGYVDALIRELELERGLLAEKVDTVFLGGGTPTFTDWRALRRLLEVLPAAAELTVEANPETITPQLATSLREAGVTRVSVGAQSFQPRVLEVLERRATPDVVRRAVHTLRDAKFDNISLDFIYGVPGQSTADLEADLGEALALGPEHLSWYELEPKPGTRFTRAHGAELERQAEAMEDYFERVVARLTQGGYRWYETANFCLPPTRDSARRDLRARHNLAYWQGRDYVGIGIGAVSTIQNRRWRNASSLPRYLEALARGERPPRELEDLTGRVRAQERVMLGLRLDEPLALAGGEDVLDAGQVARLARLGLVEEGQEGLLLSQRGRFLGGGVTADLLA